MSNYVRSRTLIELSTTSDYADDSSVELTETWTPDEWDRDTWFETNGTNATTYTTSDRSTISKIIIMNNDASNFVTVAFLTSANAATVNKIKLTAGKYIELVDVTASGNITLTADTAAVVCRITLWGT